MVIWRTLLRMLNAFFFSTFASLRTGLKHKTELGHGQNTSWAKEMVIEQKGKKRTGLKHQRKVTKSNGKSRLDLHEISFVGQQKHGVRVEFGNSFRRDNFK